MPIVTDPTQTHRYPVGSNIRAALSYARRGWGVLPLHSIRNGCCSCRKASACRSPGKHPRTKNGVYDATVVTEEIIAAWTKNPDANIGVATGSAKKPTRGNPLCGLVVIDIDVAHGGEQTLRHLEEAYGPLPKGMVVYTGRGDGSRHLYFKHPLNRDVANDVGRRLGRGIDVRGDGGYAVAPGSMHISGNPYVWGPEAFLPDLPEWVLMLLDRPVARLPYVARPTMSSLSVKDPRRWAHGALERECALFASRRVYEGNRRWHLNRAGFVLAGHVATGLVDRRLVEYELTEIALVKGLEMPEIEQTLKSAIRDGLLQPRYPEGWTQTRIDNLLAGIPTPYAEAAPLPTMGLFLG